MTDHYSFNVFWSEEDASYVALCPELPGLSAFGSSPSEAITEGRAVLDLFLEEIRESGREPPVPRTLGDYSGQFRVRLPRWLHAALVDRAHSESVSLNSLIISFLAKALGSSGRVKRRLPTSHSTRSVKHNPSP